MSRSQISDLSKKGDAIASPSSCLLGSVMFSDQMLLHPWACERACYLTVPISREVGEIIYI